MLGSEPTLEIFFLCQPEAISVLSGWDLFFKICGIVKKNKHGSWKNWGYKKFTWT